MYFNKYQFGTENSISFDSQATESSENGDISTWGAAFQCGNAYYSGHNASSYTPGSWSTPSNLSVREECLFDWFEKTYPEHFTPTGSPTIMGQYNEQSRRYESIRLYQATNSTIHIGYDNRVFVTGGPYSWPRYMNLMFSDSLKKYLTLSGCDKVRDVQPPYPIVFIHGIGSDAKHAWNTPETGASLRAYLEDNRGWTFGGIPIYRNGRVSGLLNKNANFYTSQFSSNRYITFATQGGELSEIIKSVKAKNPDKDKVILVAHSMGGLADREYLQGIAFNLGHPGSVNPYREDVDRLITIGTPHFGSHLPRFCDLLPWRTRLDFEECKPSMALSELGIASSSLKRLNEFPFYQDGTLPHEVRYVSLVGIGTTNIYIKWEDGDGIVTADSQNLGKLDPPPIQHIKSDIKIKDRSNCDKPEGHIIGLFQTHTCETGDYGVWEAILSFVR